MARTISTLSSCILAFAGIATLTPVADARSSGAWGGNPLDGNSLSCYAETGGAVRGIGFTASCTPGAPGGPPPNGGQGPRWEVQLPVDAAKSYAVQFSSMQGNGSGGPCCTAYAVSPTGTLSGSNTICSSGSGMIQRAPLNPVSVPSGGYLFLACSGLWYTDSQVGSISWN